MKYNDINKHICSIKFRTKAKGLKLVSSISRKLLLIKIVTLHLERNLNIHLIVMDILEIYMLFIYIYKYAFSAFTFLHILCINSLIIKHIMCHTLLKECCKITKNLLVTQYRKSHVKSQNLENQSSC